jgi:hypothetical protein
MEKLAENDLPYFYLRHVVIVVTAVTTTSLTPVQLIEYNIWSRYQENSLRKFKEDNRNSINYIFMTIVTGLSDSRNLDVIFVYFECCICVRCYYDTIFFMTYSVTPRTTPLERWRCVGVSGTIW